MSLLEDNLKKPLNDLKALGERYWGWIIGGLISLLFYSLWSLFFMK